MRERLDDEAQHVILPQQLVVLPRRRPLDAKQRGGAALVHVGGREAVLGRHEAGARGEQRGAIAVADDAPGGEQRVGIRRRARAPGTCTRPLLGST